MREESGVSAGVVSLPSGGGGISPLGDRFQPDLVRGSGSYAVPINLPKGSNELQPSLSLTYSTGSGNGPFGHGWQFGISRIERRSDRGIPTYTDEDEYAIGGAEVLVHVGGNRYRPRDDSRFWSIEKMAGDSWRIRTGDGRTLVFGRSNASRERGELGIFAWCLDEEQDAAGNKVNYSYRRDGDRLYVDVVRYSIFSLRFAYAGRPDVLRNGRCGFERRTALRATGIELHCDRLAPTLMRTYGLEYKQAANGVSLLSRITLSATEGVETASFPELRFNYSQLDLTKWSVEELRSLVPPPRLADSATQLVDLTGDGLADVLQTANGRTLMWRNHGHGTLDGPVALRGVPSTLSLSRENVALADLDGNGRVELFAVDQPLQLAFEADGKGGFRSRPTVFRDTPNLRLAEGDTRLTDFNGDGATDLLTTARTHLLLYRHERGRGWQEPQAIRRVADLAVFPDVSFNDRGVRLADMSGDGLQDIVVVRSGDVSYWPHLGNGRTSARVEMGNAPVFPRGYRDDRVHVVDIDGDGCSDVVYLDHDRTIIWLNQSGNRFSPPVEIPVAPATAMRPITADFFGDGRAGFAWDGAPTVADSAGYKFLHLDAAKAPYMLEAVDNGMGGRFEITYSNTTEMRLLDQADGTAWTGELPFVVHVVSSIAERETVTGVTTTLSMRYHDGVFDGPDRSFRGFKSVSVEMSGDDSVPASIQEVTFFQGDPELPDLFERDRQRARAGMLVSTRSFERTAAGLRLCSESTQMWEVRLEHDGPGGRVFFPHVIEIEAREHSPGGQPARIDRSLLSDFDAHGNPRRKVRESFEAGAAPAEVIRHEERFAYTDNEPDWLIKLPVRSELRDSDGVPWSVQIRYYDGAPFVGLAEGQATKGLPTRVRDLRLLESRIPPGYLGGRDLAAQGFELLGAGDTRGWYINSLAVRRDANGNVVEQRDPTGTPLEIAYDADALYPVKSKDARGKETKLAFNPRSGEPATVEFPDGRRVRHEYDAIGRLAAVFETDDGGVERLTKCWLLDLASLPTSITSIAPDGPGANRSDFTAATDFTAIDGASVARACYDGFGRQIVRLSTAPDAADGSRRFAATERVELNPKGVVKIFHPPQFVANLDYTPPPPMTGTAVRQRYDVQGNVIETMGPGPAHFRVVRDNFTIDHYEGAAAGAFAAAVIPGPASRVERYDGLGRLRRIEEAKGDGGTVITTYDVNPEGRVLRIRDGAGTEMASYVYAGPSQAISITHRDVGTRTYYRDAGGKVVEQVNADGATLFNVHDVQGRLRKIDHKPAAAPPVTIREIIYDTDPVVAPAGRFLEGRIGVVREAGHELRYSYNRAGKLAKEEITTGAVTLTTKREYDIQGRSTAIVYPDNHRIDYTLDRSGSVREIIGIASDILYAADGGIDSYRLQNGVEVTMPRDATSGRLQRIHAMRGGATLRRIDYTYDPVGTIRSLRDEKPGSIELQSFLYDGLYRVSGFDVRRNDAGGALLRKGEYRYDDGGNLLKLEETQPLTMSYTDAAHPGRLTGVVSGAGASPVAYDARGHISSFGNLAAIAYDALERMTQATLKDGTIVRLAYDPQSRRIRKEVTKGAVTKVARYAAGLYEQHATHAIRHVYLGKLLIASQMIDGAATTPAFFLCDHHGTVLMATDAAGAPIAQQRYSAFGAALTPNQALDRYLGRERDEETGLLHLGARYYAPSIGRFISADWYVLENPTRPARMPQGYNVYSYALNNPLVFKDPSGMFLPLLIGAVIAIAYIAAVATIAAFAIGFVAGLVYGLANGQGWSSLLTALETALTTTIGMWLGGITGFIVGGPVGLVIGAIMGGMNGLISGMTGIYNWASIDGWLAFLSDSTWGLIGTSLGNIVHIINLFYGNANYRSDLSHRQNRHVYEGGFALKSDFAFTQGNVISNAGQGGKGINPSFIAQHEELHIWQSRIFGPLFQATYIVWAVGGFIVGTVVWFFNTDQDYGSVIETAAYYDNPFEYWAYKNDSNWPPSGANPVIAYG
jgi:RHS repeat-associated protein